MRDMPRSVIEEVVDPRTGQVWPSGYHYSINREVQISLESPLLDHEIAPGIKAILDRDSQSVRLVFGEESKMEISADVKDLPRITLSEFYSRPNVEFGYFDEGDAGAILINNKRKYAELRYDEGWREDYLISKNGECLYRGEKNEEIKNVKGFDGHDYFIACKLEPGSSNNFYRLKDGYVTPYMALDIRGHRLEGEELRVLPPVEFRIQVGEHGSKASVSLFESNHWRPEIDISRGIRVVDKQTGERFFDKFFSRVMYHPDKGIWECRGVGSSVNELMFINEQGEVVEEGKIGDIKNQEYVSSVEKTCLLSLNKTISLQKAIEGYEEQDRDRITLLLNRSLEYGQLSDEAYGLFVPMLLRMNYLNPGLIDNDLILSLDKRVGKHDVNTQACFYEFLGRSLPDSIQNILKDKELFIEKVLKIFEEKIAPLPASERAEIFDQMSNVRNYRDEYLTTGWNIIENASKVPTELIPEKIRPIIEYLRTDEEASISQKKIDEISMEKKTPDFTLSQLIQAKRLNETEMFKFSGSINDLIDTVQNKTKDKRQEHIQREIIHPIYYQSVNNPYLFVRELVQNSHDILVEKKGDNKRVDIDLFSRSENSLTVRIEDPIGMDKNILLNYFLVPGETTKKDKQDQIGYFGQGLFTLFRDASEVNVKTSVGDGTVIKMKITPKYDESAILSDLDIVMEEEISNYKGTTIEKTMNTKYPTVEAAYIKNAVCSFTSLVDSNIIDINLNNAQINCPQSLMSKAIVPGLGELKIFDSPNNAITQRGLYVKSIDSDFSTGMHDIESFLNKRGYVLQIPDSIDLTRSRNEIAQKEKFLPQIKEQLSLLKIGAYLEFFRLDIVRGRIIQLDNLPYDFFYAKGRGNGKAYEDAKDIRNGIPLKDVSPYRERGALINLLIHLPVAELDDKNWSMYELRNAYLQNAAPLDNRNNLQKLPTLLRKSLEEGKRIYEQSEEARSFSREKGLETPDFSLEDIDNQPSFIKEIINKDLEKYTRFNTEVKDWFGYLDRSFSRDSEGGVDNTFFFTEEKVSAHARNFFNMIGWNLKEWRDYNIRPFGKEAAEDQEKRDFFNTLSHEYAHILEQSSGMTHNRDFHFQQSKVLAEMIKRRLT